MFNGQYLNALVITGISVCVLLSSCSNQSEFQSNSEHSENFSTSIPDAIAESRIAAADLDLSVLVNGKSVSMMQTDSGTVAGGVSEDATWTGTIPVPVGETLQFAVRWSTEGIILARLDTIIEALTSDSTVIFPSSNYTYPDDDNDNFTNLQELDAMPPTEVDNASSIPTSNEIVNPTGIDTNGDGIADAQDDTNGDGLVDSDDFTIYSRGGRGPAGGWVFYLTDNAASGIHGLEVAPVDQPPLARWYCDDETLPGAEGYIAGTGEQNSIKMLEGCASTGFVDAAVVADTYELNGFTDWFLPSLQELVLIHAIVAVDGLSVFDESVHYWSSTQGENATGAWAWDFSDVDEVLHERSDLLRVRPVRAF